MRGGVGGQAGGVEQRGGQRDGELAGAEGHRATQILFVDRRPDGLVQRQGDGHVAQPPRGHRVHQLKVGGEDRAGDKLADLGQVHLLIQRQHGAVVEFLEAHPHQLEPYPHVAGHHPQHFAQVRRGHHRVAQRPVGGHRGDAGGLQADPGLAGEVDGAADQARHLLQAQIAVIAQQLLPLQAGVLEYHRVIEAPLMQIRAQKTRIGGVNRGAQPVCDLHGHGCRSLEAFPPR